MTTPSALPFWTHRPAGERLAVPVFVGLGIEQVRVLDDSPGKPRCAEYRTAISCFDGFNTIADHADTVKKMQSDYKHYHQQKSLDCSQALKNLDHLDDFLIDWLQSFARANNYKIVGVGLACNDSLIFEEKASDAADPNKEGGLMLPLCLAKPASQEDKLPFDLTPFFERFTSKLWRALDAVPYLLNVCSASMEERASSAARKVAMNFALGGTPIPRLMISEPFNEVAVDHHGCVRLCSLSDYENLAAQFNSEIPYFDVLQKLASQAREQKLRITFLSSTPQGGGVAIMRHCLLRLLRLLKIDARWCVPRPKPSVFQITKRKFHNVLQGVLAASKLVEKAAHVVESEASRQGCDSANGGGVGSDGGTGDRLLSGCEKEAEKTIDSSEFELTDSDKELWEGWCRQNYEEFWTKLVRDSHMVVIDDPQLCALIPIIKKDNPKCFVAYRSHIQIDTKRIDSNGGDNVHAHTWHYLWDNFIRLADVFIAHPFDSSVPSSVPKERVGFMPATTDPLDGLNKSLCDWDKLFYFKTFSRLSSDQTDKTINCKHTKYIIQVARFDPSKGIPDVLDAFRLLCEKLGLPPACQNAAECSEAEKQEASSTCKCSGKVPDEVMEKIPHLILCGHSAIDDPEGNTVYEYVLHLLHTSKFHHIASFVCVARLPPSDQLANALLANALVALQLSHREGFEIKITEAMLKGIPVIAYRTGGIPLQIAHGENGFLVDVGNQAQVADYLYQLLSNEDLYKRMSHQAQVSTRKALMRTPIGEANSWLYIALKALAQGQQTKDKEKEKDKTAKENPVKYDVSLNSQRVVNLWQQELLPLQQ